MDEPSKMLSLKESQRQRIMEETDGISRRGRSDRSEYYQSAFDDSSRLCGESEIAARPPLSSSLSFAQTSSAYVLLQLKESDGWGNVKMWNYRDHAAMTHERSLIESSAMSSPVSDLCAQRSADRIEATNFSHQSSLVDCSPGPIALNTFQAFQSSRKRGSSNDRCRCKKSKCLKMYCQCFAARRMCGIFCVCCDCHNTLNHAEEKKRVVDSMLSRDPNVFEGKIKVQSVASSNGVTAKIPLVHRNGCKCRKSFCLKNYCECFDGGVRCGERCGCLGCKNGGIYRDAPRNSFSSIVGEMRWQQHDPTTLAAPFPSPIIGTPFGLSSLNGPHFSHCAALSRLSDKSPDRQDANLLSSFAFEARRIRQNGCTASYFSNSDAAWTAAAVSRREDGKFALFPKQFRLRDNFEAQHHAQVGGYHPEPFGRYVYEADEYGSMNLNGVASAQSRMSETADGYLEDSTVDRECDL